MVCRIIAIIILIVIFTGCPTPFGLIYADKITHWNGETETIEEWLGDEEEEIEYTDVTIEINWGD